MGKGIQRSVVMALIWIVPFSLFAIEGRGLRTPEVPPQEESVVSTNAPQPAVEIPVREENENPNSDVVKMAEPVSEQALGRLTIEYPHPGEVVPGGEVQIFFKMIGSEIPEAEQMVHVFVNNRPPILHQDLRTPFILKGLPDGAVFLRALAVDGRGVAFPLPDSFASTRFYIRSKDFRNSVDPSESYVTLNLPFVGRMAVDAANRLPMQFFVHRGTGKEEIPLRVRYTLNGIAKEVNHDGMVLLNNLQAGRYHLRVELLQPDGEVELGAFAYAEREFEILRIMKPLPMVRDPTEMPY